MALDRKKLEKWVRSSLLSTAEDNPIIRMTLRHAMGGQKSATVADVEVKPSDSFIEISSRFEEAATNDAEGLGSMQSYVISSYYQSAPDRIRERFAFKLAVQTDDDDIVESSEAPNTTGLVTQLMRHNEALARTMTMGMSEMQRQQNRVIERQGSIIDMMMGKHVDVLSMYEEMLVARSSGELEKMQLVATNERTDKVIEKVLTFAPIVMNRLTAGKSSVPQGDDTPEGMMMMKFASSLTAEQFQVIAGTLGPEQQLVLFELIESQRRKAEAAEASKAEAGKKKKT